MTMPPTRAPGIEPKPPSTAAAKAFSATARPMLMSISVTGASRMPAAAAVPAEIAQIREKISLTGMPM